jgi:hypothetical protein
MQDGESAWVDRDDWDNAASAEEPPAQAAEIIRDPAPASAMDGAADGAADAVFAALLAALRALPGPCAPPIGEGAFDILYASPREIVVWFVSAKDGAGQREVAIPARLAREAWALIRQGAPVSEAMLRALAAGAAGGRWLLALFAQLPSVEVRQPDQDAQVEQAAQAVMLLWRGEPLAPLDHAKDAAP